MKLAFFALAFFAGVAIAVQAAVNAQLRARLGDPMHATLVSFGVGTVAAIIYVLVARIPAASWTVVIESPWWVWIGGLLGIVYVWSSVVVGPRVGFGVLLSMGIAGQMVTSLLIDHYGWFRADAVPVQTTRLLGVMLVVFGAALLALTK